MVDDDDGADEDAYVFQRSAHGNNELVWQEHIEKTWLLHLIDRYHEVLGSLVPLGANLFVQAT